MTLLRRLALKISNTVVKYASPGAKEWAEGLAQEVAFVEGDWAALGWALGSVRVLFDYREAPIGSLAELSTAAEKFAQLASDNRAWFLSACSFFWDLIFVRQFFRATNGPLERVGCSLVVLGWAVLGTVMLIDWRSQRKVPPSSDVNAVIQFYRAELKRRLHSGRQSWTAISAATILLAGLTLAEWAVWTPYVCALLWVGTMLLFLQMRRINRRRLERLEALLAERS